MKGSTTALLKEFVMVFVQPIGHPLAQRAVLICYKCFRASPHRRSYRNLVLVHVYAIADFHGLKAVGSSLRYKKPLLVVKMVPLPKATRAWQLWHVRTGLKSRTKKKASLSTSRRHAWTFSEKASKSIHPAQPCHR